MSKTIHLRYDAATASRIEVATWRLFGLKLLTIETTMRA